MDPIKQPYNNQCTPSGSVPNSVFNSSATNTDITDDEDSDMGQKSREERRREAHTQAEQKRRDAIKKGYDSLQLLVPMCQNSDQNQGHKLSKAAVLQKSIDYIQYMQNDKRKQEEEVALLKKESVGMGIMKSNYEQIVKGHQNQPGQLSKQIPDDLKFQVFRAFMDSLYKTFEPSLQTRNFDAVSISIISWVEEHCQPQILREVMGKVIEQVEQYDASRNQQVSKMES